MTSGQLFSFNVWSSLASSVICVKFNLTDSVLVTLTVILLTILSMAIFRKHWTVEKETKPKMDHFQSHFILKPCNRQLNDRSSSLKYSNCESLVQKWHEICPYAELQKFGWIFFQWKPNNTFGGVAVCQKLDTTLSQKFVSSQVQARAAAAAPWGEGWSPMVIVVAYWRKRETRKIKLRRDKEASKEWWTLS